MKKGSIVGNVALALLAICTILSEGVTAMPIAYNNVGGRDSTLQATMIKDAGQQLKVADSLTAKAALQKSEIEKEISNLRNSEGKKRDELLGRLRKIEQDDSLRKVDLGKRVALLKMTTKGNPVVLYNDTLFNIYTNIGSFTAKERAKAVSDRVSVIYDDDKFDQKAFSTQDNDGIVEVRYRDVVISGVGDLDAVWVGKTKQQLANDYLLKVKNAVIKHKEQNSLKNILIRILLVVVILVAFVIVVKLINKLFKRIQTRLFDKGNKLSKGLVINNYQVMDNRRVYVMIGHGLKILKLLLIVLIFYLTLPLVFGLFPYTKDIAAQLYTWISTPVKRIVNGFVEFIPNLLTIAVIYVFTHYFIRLLKYIAKDIEEGELKLPGFYPDWAKPTYNILKFLSYAFMFVMMYPYIPGSKSAVFQGVSVFLGILVSFGSSSAISNMVAGLVITYMRPFKIGDDIKINDISGVVVEKNMLVTRIRTIKNEDITIPNSSVLSNHTINYSTPTKEKALIIYTSVTIGYDAPWRQVHELLITAALKTDRIMSDEHPFVRQTSLDDWYVSYQINVFTDQPGSKSLILSDLHQNIQDGFNEAGVEIMSPHYRAQRDGNATTIPSTYLPNDYEPPAFRVERTDKKQ